MFYSGNTRAIDAQLFVIAFVSLLYFTYTYSGFVTKLPASAVTRKEVLSGCHKSLIWKNVYYLLLAIIELFENVVESYQVRKWPYAIIVF